MDDGAKSEVESSLRDDLAKGLAELQSAPEQVEAPAPEAEANPEPSETDPDRGDGRDAHGRFVSKSGSQEGEAPPQAKAPNEPDGSSKGEPSAEQSSPPEDKQVQDQQAADAPPTSWRADEAKVWSNLPPEAKSAIQRREADAKRLAGANDAERMFGREFAEIVRPHMDTIQQFGVSPQFAVRALLDSDRILRSGTPEQKLEKARQLITDYGIDLTALANAQPQDPNVVALNQKLAQIEQRLTNPPGQQFAPLPPSSVESNIMAEIEAFRADPAHPHFDAVHEHMGKLLETGAAPDLESAYQAAVALNPVLRSTAPQPQRTQQEDKTAAARRASASVTGSPGRTGSPTPMSLRDELAEGMRGLGFRGI